MNTKQMEEQQIYTPTLCFGTFFILLSEARNEKVTEEDLFNALMRIILGKDYHIVSGLNYYKACVRNKRVPSQLSFSELDAFNKKFQSGECNVASTMDEVISLLEKNKCEKLVKALIELLHCAVDISTGEPQISNENEFYIGASKPLKKNELKSIVEVDLTYFILSVYRFILNNCNDNTIGHATYNIWCPKQSSSNERRDFRNGPTGSTITQEIKIMYCNSDSDEIVANLGARLEYNLPLKVIDSVISQIRSIQTARVISELIFFHTKKMSAEILNYAIERITEIDKTELGNLCWAIATRNRAREPIFDSAIRKLAKWNQEDIYDIFEELHFSNSPVFWSYFEDSSLLTDKTLRKQFILNYLPSVQEAQAELPPDFEQIILNYNSFLRESQRKVRVYSWDDLEFDSVYVAPYLNITNKSEDEWKEKEDTGDHTAHEMPESMVQNPTKIRKLEEAINSNNSIDADIQISDNILCEINLYNKDVDIKELTRIMLYIPEFFPTRNKSLGSNGKCRHDGYSFHDSLNKLSIERLLGLRSDAEEISVKKST